MKPRKQRMLFVGVIVSGVALATMLILLSLGENLMYFYSPSQIKAGLAPNDATIRVGGLVVAGTVVHSPDSLNVSFNLSDTAQEITVHYKGMLPDLFREGQGVVAIGKLEDMNTFRANKVLAKHDENYMPPEVSDALETAAKGGSMSLPTSHIGD